MVAAVVVVARTLMMMMMMMMVVVMLILFLISPFSKEKDKSQRVVAAQTPDKKEWRIPRGTGTELDVGDGGLLLLLLLLLLLTWSC